MDAARANYAIDFGIFEDVGGFVAQLLIQFWNINWSLEGLKVRFFRIWA